MAANRIAIALDGYKIIIERITDFMIPLTILKNEAISAEIYEDGCLLDVPDLVHEYWLSSHLNENVIGCYRVHPMGAITWQIHSRILPQYRGRVAQDSGVEALRWAFKNIAQCETIMCFVPKCHRNVCLYCRQIGFEYQGTLKRSYLKNSTIYDQDIFAISKEKLMGE